MTVLLLVVIMTVSTAAAFALGAIMRRIDKKAE